MALEVGHKLGPYEVISTLGAGGMGVVYRARDTRLDRTVAIKVLPEELGAHPELRERFEREARAISSLSHPHICALYDVGRAGETDYLVMEYLEGETLAERIARGPVPTSQTVRIGAQIADALHKAHRAGITHRDLKPGNVMLTPAGAKLLDFGLAKLAAPAPRVFSDHSAPPTQASPLTGEGMIVGTFQYMSPEQLEGKPVDHRTDIFSLGIILYEMLSGRRPFEADSPASLIASILSRDPEPIRSVQPATPPALERIILTALEKDPDERWQTAQDLARQLRWISDVSLESEKAPAPRRRGLSALTILAVATASAALGWAVTRAAAPVKAERPPVRLHFALPSTIVARSHNDHQMFALSPDGRSLAFIARSGGESSLYLRSIGSYELRKLEGTSGALAPFWSSDGLQIGYSAGGRIWRIRAAGDTPPETVCQIAAGGARASWHGDTILFGDSSTERLEIFRVGADGRGEPAKLTTVQGNDWRHNWPVFLPDGRHYLYLAYARDSIDRELRLASLDDQDETVLTTSVSAVRPLGAERLAWVRDGKLLAQRLDLRQKRLVGDPVTLAEHVDYFFPTAHAEFDASPGGTVVYRTDTSTTRLAVFDRNGAEVRVIEDKEIVYDHALSPDGQRAAVTLASRGTGLMDIWIYDLARSVRDRFSSEPGNEVTPGWSPDGSTIVYMQAQGGGFPNLALRRVGSPTIEDLTPHDAFHYSPVFSAAGDAVYYTKNVGGGSDIHRIVLETRQSEALLADRHVEYSPQPSPDGKWLAFVSTATGPAEVYLQSLDDPAVRLRISTNGGDLPRWRADGNELLYVSGRQILGVTPDAAGRWATHPPTPLFRMQEQIRTFSVFPDGNSFVVGTWSPGETDDLFHVIVNAN